MFDWLVVNLAYKPYDMIDDFVRENSEVMEWLGLVTFTFMMVWLLFKTTNIASVLGLRTIDK